MPNNQKCLCHKPADRFCIHPTPIARNADKQCGFPLCGKCAEGPEATLCPVHHHELKIDVWMIGLMAAAIEHGMAGDQLIPYRREMFCNFRGYFRQGVSPEEAFAEDIELGKMIEQFAGKG